MPSHRSRTPLAVLAFGVGWLAAGAALAAEAEDDRPWYDRAQAGMSSWLVGTAAGLDSFFGDPRAIEEDYTETYARLQMGITESRLNDTEWTSRVYAKVALPRLSRRLNIFVVGGEEDQSVAAKPEESLRQTEKSSTVGVQYVLDETDRGRWSLSGSLSPNVKLRYRYLHPLGAGWYTRYTQNLYWDKDKETGIELRGDLERVIADNTLFRLTLDADYWGAATGVNWVAGGALLHRLDGRSALALDASASGVSEPTWEVAQYRTGLRYRRNFFRSWLFYEIEPALRWTQEPLNPADRMTFDPAITFRLEIQFGKVTGL
ncbi:hypothetical protein [Thiofaba sp. EF100]|uniref:hypothetical protein n=1 Tax=Thiofaba sp. EF100 TaxID=3121274 RepID=UPI0032214974